MTVIYGDSSKIHGQMLQGGRKGTLVRTSAFEMGPWEIKRERIEVKLISNIVVQKFHLNERSKSSGKCRGNKRKQSMFGCVINLNPYRHGEYVVKLMSRSMVSLTHLYKCRPSLTAGSAHAVSTPTARRWCQRHPSRCLSLATGLQVFVKILWLCSQNSSSIRRV